MLIKQDSTPAAAVAPPATACGNCGIEERRLLHHVRHRGVFRRLCTSCVLRLHPQSFCPNCFHVHPPHPSNDAVLTCIKCYSVSHSHCLSAGTTSPPNSYTCPLCIRPSTPIFKLEIRKEANVDYRVMDRDAAKMLLAAAKIATASMNKATVASKAEAERRAREAAIARKRAKEALEHAAYLVMKEKLRKTDMAGDASGSGIRIGLPQLKRENNLNVHSRNGVGVSPAMAVEEKVNVTGNGDRIENSNQVLAALNAVELRENEKTGGRTTELGIHDRAAMDVDGRRRMSMEKINGGSDRVMFADMQRDKEEDDEDDEVIVVEPPSDNNKMH